MIPFIFVGAGCYGFICIAAAYEDEFSLGWFAMGMATLIVAVLYPVYIFRGRGPTTAEVKEHIASLEARESWDDDAEEWASSSTPPGGFRSFVWHTMFNEGRAQAAHQRGEADFDAKLRVDNGEFRYKLREIEGQGWRLVHRTLHKKDRQADTQHATYYFVRADD